MSHTLKTLSAGDITRAALPILHNEMPFIKSISKQYDDRFAKTGAKNGGTILIREPNQFLVREGWTIDVQDVTETTQTYSISTVRGVDIEFSTADLTLSIDDFSERFLKPAMTRLAAQIEKETINNVYKQVYNLENTTFGTKPVYADVLAAKSVLNQGLAPRTDRYLMTDTLAADNIIKDAKDLYNPTSEISKQYLDGVMGRCGGFNFLESELTPLHTNGTRDTAGTCNLSGLVNGDTHLSLTQTNDEIINVGDIITVAGVYEVNPETKDSTGVLKQFVCATAYTGTGAAADMTVAWPIYKDGAKQNCYCADWTAATAATVVDLVGSSGTASTAYRNALAYHKNAFVFATVDLEQPKGVDMADRFVMDGISMSLVRDFNIVNRTFPLRIDIMFTSKCVIPQWACRVSS